MKRFFILLLSALWCAQATAQQPSAEAISLDGRNIKVANRTPLLKALGGSEAGRALFAMPSPGNSMIMAWNESGVLTPVPKATFLNRAGGNAITGDQSLTGDLNVLGNMSLLAGDLSVNGQLDAISFTGGVVANSLAASGPVNFNTGVSFNFNGAGSAAAFRAASGSAASATTVNGHALSGNVTVTTSDIGAVPVATTVNGHALSGNVTVTKSDVGLGNADNTSDVNKPVSTATQTALAGKLSNVFQAPVERINQRILVCDKFDGPAFVSLTLTPPNDTRNASPGPGVMTAVSLPGVSQLVAGKNALTVTRTPSYVAGGSTSFRYAGIASFDGLTMITRFVPPALGTGSSVYSSFDFLGFALSSTDIASNSAGAFRIYNGGNTNSEGVNIMPFFKDGATPLQVDTTSIADFGELVSVLVTIQGGRPIYYMQGGAAARSRGCDNYTDNWICMGQDLGTITPGTTLYPFVTRSNISGGQMTVREVTVLSSWAPSPRNGLLDSLSTGNGVHCPSAIKDPTTGLLVVAWDNGTTHENIDTKINARTRLTDGSWSALQTLVPAFGPPSVMNIGGLSNVGGALWLTYWRNPSTGGGGTLYKRILTVNGTAGTITVGSESSLGITGTNNLAATHMVTIPSGANAGRILYGLHDGATFNGYVARSDDGGSTWTKSAAFAKPASVGGWTVEVNVYLESNGVDVGCVMRTAGAGAHYCKSTDGGVTFSTPEPLYNMPGNSRLIVKNRSDGSILVIGTNQTAQRRNITAWRMGDNGQVYGSTPLGDSAISGSVGGTIYQYPDFVEDGNDLFYVFSHQGSVGFTSMEFHTRRWSGDLALAYEAVGDTKKTTSNEVYYPGQSHFLGPQSHYGRVLPYAASVVTPCKESDKFSIYLTGPLTLSAPLNPLEWQTVSWAFVQDATGSRVLTLDSIFETPPFTPVLSTAGNSTDYMDATWNPNKGKWQVTNFLSAKTGYSADVLTGRVVNGGTSASGTLTLASTSHATKGKILMGTLAAYDEVNERLGLGTLTPGYPLDVQGNVFELGSFYRSSGSGAGFRLGNTGGSINFGMTIGTYGALFFTGVTGGSDNYFVADTNSIRVKSGSLIGFTASASTPTGACDTWWYRNAANVMRTPGALIIDGGTTLTGGTTIGAGGTAVTKLRHGTATLVSGTVTVTDTAITTNSRVFVNRFTDGGTIGDSYSITRSAGANFTITSKTANATVTADTSVVAYEIIEP